MPCGRNNHLIYIRFLFLTTLCKRACVEGNQLKPFIEWCENSKERRRAEDCGGVAFVYPYPKCYCLSGIALIKVAHDVHAVREVQFGTGGCYSQRSLGAHNRTIQLAHAQEFNANDTVLGLQTSEESFEFFNAPLKEPKPVRGRIVLFNGDIIDMGEKFKKGRLFCVEKSVDIGQDSDLVRMFAMPPASWIWYNESCNGGEHAELEILHAGRLLTPETSPCFPDCPPYDPKNVPHNRPSPRLANTTDCKPMPHKLRDVHRDLNERMLRHAIDHSFEGQPEPTDNKPSNSFKILEMLSQIASKFCRNAHVPLDFLQVAADYFKVAHEGRGYYFNEEFSHHEFMSISQLLRRCLFYMNETLQFKSTGCTDRREVTEVFKLMAPTDRRPVVKSVGHEYFDHHAVLDVPWTMVDLVNVACVDAFAPSYRMYHRMVQGMEKLFTHELRTFWQFPQVPPFYYEHLFGPNWKTHSSNLEKCVEGAYIFAPKMARMVRPQWLPGQTGNSRGKGTFTDPVCRRSRTDIQSISEAFEIYCEPTKPPSDIFIDWPDFDAEDPSAIAHELDISWPELNNSLSNNEIYIDAEYNLPDVIGPIHSITNNIAVGKPSPTLPIETTWKPAHVQSNHTTTRPTEKEFLIDLPEADEATSSSVRPVKYYIAWPHRIARQSETFQQASQNDSALGNNSAVALLQTKIVDDASVLKSKDNEISNYIDETDQMLDDVSISEPRQTLRERRSFIRRKPQRPALIDWPSDPSDPLLPLELNSHSNSKYPRQARTIPKPKVSLGGENTGGLYGQSSPNELDPLLSGGPDPDLDALITWRTEDIHAAGDSSSVELQPNLATSDAIPNAASNLAPVLDYRAADDSPTKSEGLDYPVENLSDALETKNPSVPSGMAAETMLTDVEESESTVENNAEVFNYPMSNADPTSDSSPQIFPEWPVTRTDEAEVSSGNYGTGFQDGDPLVSGTVLEYPEYIYSAGISAFEDEKPIYLVWPGDFNTKGKRASYPDIFLDWPQTNEDTVPSKVEDPAAPPGLIPEPEVPSRKDPVGPPGIVLDLQKRPKSNNMHPPGTLLDLQKRKKPYSHPPGTLLDLRKRKHPQSVPKGKLLDLSKRRKFVPPGHHQILLDLPRRTSPKPSLVHPVGKLLDLQKHSKTSGRTDDMDEEPVYIQWPSALTRRVRDSQHNFAVGAPTHERAKKSQAVKNFEPFLHANEAGFELEDIYPTNSIEVSNIVLDAEDIYPTDGSKSKRSNTAIADPTNDIYRQERFLGSPADYPDFSDVRSDVSSSHPRSVAADDLYDGPPMLDIPMRSSSDVKNDINDQQYPAATIKARSTEKKPAEDSETSKTPIRTDFELNSSELASVMNNKVVELPMKIPSTASSSEEQNQPNSSAPVRIYLQLAAENHTNKSDFVRITWPVISPAGPNSVGPKAPSKDPIKSDVITYAQQSGPSETNSQAPEKNITSPIQIDLQLQNQSVMPLENASSTKPIRLDLPILISNGASELNGNNGTELSSSTTDTILHRPLDSDDNDPIVYINLPPKAIENSPGSRSLNSNEEGGAFYNEMRSMPHKMNVPTDASIVDMYVPIESEGLSCTHSDAMHGLVPFKNSCTLFYSCNLASNTSMLIVFKCIDGHIFNISKQNCIVGVCNKG